MTDDTQKRIAWIKEARRTVLEGGTVAMFEAQAMVENDIPWLLEQIDEAARKAKIMDQLRGDLAQQLEEAEQRLDGYGAMCAEHEATIADRDAEIARLDLEIKKAWAKTEWLKTQTKCAWCAGENSACTWCNP